MAKRRVSPLRARPLVYRSSVLGMPFTLKTYGRREPDRQGAKKVGYAVPVTAASAAAKAGAVPGRPTRGVVRIDAAKAATAAARALDATCWRPAA